MIMKTSSIALEILVILTAIVLVLLLNIGYNGNVKVPAFAKSSYSPHLNSTVSNGPHERVSFSPMADPSPLSAERKKHIRTC
jgi:hypothetical protein